MMPKGDEEYCRLNNLGLKQNSQILPEHRNVVASNKTSENTNIHSVSN